MDSLSFHTTIEEILSHLKDAGACLCRAAETFARATAEDPEFPARAREAAPWIKPATWQALEDCAAKKADWRVAFDLAPHADHLRRLPAKLQARVLDQGVDVAAGPDILRLQVAHLTGCQAKVIFGGGTVRTPSEQAAMTRAPIKKKAGRTRSVLWKANRKNQTVEVFAPCILTVSDVADMLSAIGG